MAGKLAMLVALTMTVASCGGATTFVGDRSLSVKGDAPPPPPPPAPKRVEVTEKAIVIHDTIHFEWNKAEIRSESFGLLDEIVSVIQDNPQIKKISIEGHTDSTGRASYNQELSEGRAASVMNYLTEHGVTAERLSSKGFGPSVPVADNETEEGRAKNRRVEFIIVEQDEVKKLVEVDPVTGDQRDVRQEKKQ